MAGLTRAMVRGVLEDAYGLEPDDAFVEGAYGSMLKGESAAEMAALLDEYVAESRSMGGERR